MPGSSQPYRRGLAEGLCIVDPEASNPADAVEVSMSHGHDLSWLQAGRSGEISTKERILTMDDEKRKTRDERFERLAAELQRRREDVSESPAYASD